MKFAWRGKFIARFEHGFLTQPVVATLNEHHSSVGLLELLLEGHPHYSNLGCLVDSVIPALVGLPGLSSFDFLPPDLSNGSAYLVTVVVVFTISLSAQISGNLSSNHEIQKGRCCQVLSSY
ncbi:hypothetical protein FRX31_019679 [Thalictrum thalictroides]|uniref:Uncharacterized protein n=1 Tax=Thalictrum thalictroides TaxID=46969 RepID=A0A7J6W343_THATH|nr:hypothetical protein FRX31_019679 [Thalictrum thalictroides]